MPRLNRVDPFGDLHRVEARGLFTGNRGCLVDEMGEVVRHHRGDLWITCVLAYKDWRAPLERPRHWTPIFFLDDAVALAAGHRPCGLCRRDDYETYRDSVGRALGWTRPPSALDLNRMLRADRLERGRGLVRGRDRKTWSCIIDDLPDGTVLIDEDRNPLLVLGNRLMSFRFEGWSSGRDRPRGTRVEVLTPATSVSALANGFIPTLHPSAAIC